LSETKIYDIFPEKQFELRGYNMVRSDRDKNGEGIIAYINDTIFKMKWNYCLSKLELTTKNISSLQHTNLNMERSRTHLDNLMTNFNLDPLIKGPTCSVDHHV